VSGNVDANQSVIYMHQGEAFPMSEQPPGRSATCRSAAPVLATL
jgi:hypothetical protein